MKSKTVRRHHLFNPSQIDSACGAAIQSMSHLFLCPLFPITCTRVDLLRARYREIEWLLSRRKKCEIFGWHCWLTIPSSFILYLNPDWSILSSSVTTSLLLKKGTIELEVSKILRIETANRYAIISAISETQFTVRLKQNPQMTRTLCMDLHLAIVGCGANFMCIDMHIVMPAYGPVNILLMKWIVVWYLQFCITINMTLCFKE